MEAFLSAMLHRFACKRFADTPIPPDLLEAILECGRLSPSSFGLEGWRFQVVASYEVRQKLFEACFSQEPVGTAPISIVITVRTALAYHPEGAFVRQRGERFPGSLEDFIADYRGYYDFLTATGRTACWSRLQGYIAAANMMTGAASAGIQSCAIEGFDETQVLALLGVDRQKWQVALVIAFGYPTEPERPKIREPLHELVSYF